MKKRYWQPAKGDNQRRNSFARFLKAKGLTPTPLLWETYKNWRNKRQEFVAFHQAYEEAKAITEALVANWKNPFKNAKKGQPYDLIIQLPVNPFIFNGLNELGLQYQRHPHKPGYCRISGTPAMAGEFPITLLYKPRGFTGSDFPVLKRTFKLIINPDPKDLWNNIPSDPDLEYARPDQESLELHCGTNWLIAASQRGRSHAHKGLPRDDAFGLACENGWQILAVSDGAGSAEFSRKGAEIACSTAIGTITAKLPVEAAQLEELLAARTSEQEDWQAEARKLAYAILAQAAFEAHKAIRQEAADKSRETKLYACTLLLAMAKKISSGWVIVSFQVGDGAMAMFTENGAELLARPDEGEFSGQTRFITMNDIFDGHELMRRLRVALVPCLETLILLTDGVSDPRFGTQEGLENKELWQNLRSDLQKILKGDTADLLEWLNFWETGHHDDRTVALLITDNSCQK